MLLCVILSVVASRYAVDAVRCYDCTYAELNGEVTNRDQDNYDGNCLVVSEAQSKHS